MKLTFTFICLCAVITQIKSYGKSNKCFNLLHGRWYEHKWIPYPWLPFVLQKNTKEFTMIEPGLININITGRNPNSGECTSFSVVLRETELSGKCRCDFKIVNTRNLQGDTNISDLSLVRTRFRDVIIFFGCALRENKTAKCTRKDAWVNMRSEFLTFRQKRVVNIILRKLGLGRNIANGEFSRQDIGRRCQSN